ncbi:MAG: hypothetical protein ACI9TK_000745 [Flavobacteriaceae bacterium]
MKDLVAKAIQCMKYGVNVLKIKMNKVIIVIR